MKKVVKFGGSSLASAAQFKKVGDIIRADKQRAYVVPSAPGKRFNEDTKVTDMLYGCYALAEADKDFAKELEAIHDRYKEIIDGLKLDLSMDAEFATIAENFKAKAGKDYAASRGEYLNGIIMAAEKLGKYKTVCQDIALFILLLAADIPALAGQIVAGVGFGLLAVATVLTVWSGIAYVVKNKQVIKED